MSLRARILLAALFSLGAFTMAAPTGTTTTITTSTTTSTTPSTHHLHAYLTTVASKLLFETATPTPILHPIVERRNDPHIRMHKDGFLYSDSNTITTTTTHHNKNNKNTMMKKKGKKNKKEHTDSLIRISKDGFFRPLNYSEAYIYWDAYHYLGSVTDSGQQHGHHSDDHGRGRQNHPEEKEEKEEVVGKIDIEKEVYVKSRECWNGGIGKMEWCEMREGFDLIAGPGVNACTYFNFQKKDLRHRYCQ